VGAAVSEKKLTLNCAVCKQPFDMKRKHKKCFVIQINMGGKK
jgi:hypothetical protein